MKTKVYVVTGATSGIGQAIVKELAKDNIVFAGFRSESKWEELKAFSENVYPFYVDYAKPETISKAIEYIKSNCDKVDTLINIAGCVVAGPVEKVSIDEIRRQFNVNVSTNQTNPGTITGGGKFDYGSSATISVSVNPGYNFIGWYKNCFVDLLIYHSRCYQIF